MKIALIAPPYPLSESPAPPLGLCCAAAAFEAAGCEVRILDYIVSQYTPTKLKAEVERFSPDIVGINSVTLNFRRAAEILQTVKEMDDSIITVMGGPHVSFDFHQTLQRYPGIDLIVVGEGEETIRELVPVAADRDAWPHVRGIAFAANGAVRYTGKREFIADLDALPLPARHLLPLSRYQAMGFPISLITSRGCPNQCIFCQGCRMVGSRVRNRSPEKVVDEIEAILSYGFRRINFADDFFTVSKKRVGRICSEIRRRGLSFGWSAFARADSVDRDLLCTLKKAGCDALLFGIESGNQEMLDRVGKRIRLERIREAVADARAAGMNIFGSFIAGLPGETLDTLRETHVFDDIDQFDLQLLTDDWSRFDANHPVTRTAALSAEDVEQFVYDNYLKVIEAEEICIAQRFQENRCSATEWMQYMGKQKNEIVFQIFSNDLIERHGTVPDGHRGVDPAKLLIENLQPFLENDSAIVATVMKEIIEKGFLTCRPAAGSRRWQWAKNSE
jgi:anaerobic magnesium-protoporphyrin IX monomethyl ester cyclase